MKKIKLRCNGQGRHVNEVDLDKVLRREIVLRSAEQVPEMPSQHAIPERIVVPCRYCTDGKIIVTQEIIMENLKLG